MAEPVVHELEVVDVGEAERELPAIPAGVLELLAKSLVEVPMVAETG